MGGNLRIFRNTLVTAIMAVCSPLIVLASDPNQLQDFCVATDSSRGVLVNGKFCKDPVDVTDDDFFSPALRRIGDIDNKQGSATTPVTVEQLPSLNTLGISMSGIDFAPNGLNPPHIHPRATEILTVIEGALFVGFISSNQPTGRSNRLFTKVLHKGDVFVFPQGLIHFQRNIGGTAARAIAALTSQSPGVITIANAVFGSDPIISKDVLMRAFQVDKKVVMQLQAQFEQ